MGVLGVVYWDILVLQPLSTLLLLFEAPNKVIQKRYHKLLDYGNLSRKAKDDKVSLGGIILAIKLFLENSKC